jgi:hypothetical protein
MLTVWRDTNMGEGSGALHDSAGRSTKLVWCVVQQVLGEGSTAGRRSASVRDSSALHRG